jgi:hypothetical protein
MVIPHEIISPRTCLYPTKPSALQPHDTGIAHGGCNLLGESGQTFLIPWDDFFNIELVADASTYL